MNILIACCVKFDNIQNTKLKSILDFRTLYFGWCLVATTLHDSIYTCDTDASKLASHLEINKAICLSDLRQNMAKLLNRLCETELVTLLACLAIILNSHFFIRLGRLRWQFR